MKIWLFNFYLFSALKILEPNTFAHVIHLLWFVLNIGPQDKKTLDSMHMYSIVRIHYPSRFNTCEFFLLRIWRPAGQLIKPAHKPYTSVQIGRYCTYVCLFFFHERTQHQAKLLLQLWRLTPEQLSVPPPPLPPTNYHGLISSTNPVTCHCAAF